MAESMDGTAEKQVSGSHHFYHDMQGTDPLSASVISAVAEVRDAEPMALGFSLHDYVDPDALDSLFAPTLDGTTRGAGRVAFTVPGHRVLVESDGHILVTEED